MSTPQPPVNPYQQQPNPYQQQPASPYQQQPGAVPPAASPYQQPGAPVYRTGPQRNMLVFVSSIILVVFAGITLIFMLATIGIWTNPNLGLLSEFGGGPGQGVIITSGVLSIICAAFQIGVGILGLMNSHKLEKANLLFLLGCALGGLAFLSMVFGFIANGAGGFMGLLGFVLPALFVYGAYQMKQQAQAQGIPQVQKLL